MALRSSAALFAVNKQRIRAGVQFLHYDVVIAGGAVMGSSVAYFLKTRAPGLKIAVVEQDPTYAKASSSLSFASIRQQFSIVQNILMSRWSWNFLEQSKVLLQVPGDDPPDVQMCQGSYLFLASTQDGYQTLLSNYEIQRANGVPVQLLSSTQLAAKFPWLNVEDIVAGSVGCGYEGWFDGWSLLSAFRKKALNLGVEYISGSVTSLNIQSLVREAHIAHGGQTRVLQCSNFVNATGPWAGKLMQQVGIHLPVWPRKRYVFVMDCPNGPGRDMPLLICPSGAHSRPEGKGNLYLAGFGPSEEDEPDVTNLDVDHDFFTRFTWPCLAKRVPAFEEVKVRNAWAGYYEYNELDQNAIIGPHSDIKNLYFVNGFSGHGIQQSPAAGNAVSELIVDGKFTAIDLTAFGYQRVKDNIPLQEKNVV